MSVHRFYHVTCRAASRQYLSSGYQTNSNTNRDIHLQRLARGLRFRIKEVEEFNYYVAKIKPLPIAAQLICDFDFAYAKSRF